MNRFKSIAAISMMLLSAIVPVLSASAASNLIANPSVETITNAVPNNWQANRWGTNTATLSVSNEGHTGTKSLYIDMTARTDGDAKWMADPVTVSPNTSYTYSSFYKSNVATEIDLQYTDTAGNVSYAYVQQVPASTTWQAATATFVTPANAAKVVVMQVVAQPGWLQLDDFTLDTTATTPTPPTTPPVTPPTTPPTTPPADTENLMLNPSFETASGALPASWTKNTWGTNTTQFTYDTSGHTGGRSVSTKITKYTTGDSKWYAQPIAVQAGKSYIYRDFYKSTVTTRVIIAYVDSANKYTYVELPTAATSSAWKQYSATFTVPATAKKATVSHVIDRVGSLTLDDTALQVSNPPATTTAVIPNNSFETAATATMPAQWQQGSWGSNTPSFEYVNEGHTGTKSAKVTVSNYVDGDAKWFFDPIKNAVPGQQYRLNLWYKTNVKPQMVMMYTTADGAEHYFGMPAPQPTAATATTWQQYSDTFLVPTGAVSVSAFMFINQNGWLQTDDYSLTDYHPNGFTKPLLTLTFDDGEEENVDSVLPVLKQYGFKSTQCFATTFIEGNTSAIANVKAFQNAGHEICSHTVTHPMMTTLDPTTLTYELQHAQQYLQSITGLKVDDFASPYGDYDANVNAQIKKFYRAHRTVDEGFNSKDNFDIYRLRVQNMLDTTTAAQVKQWVEQAKADRTWLILVYHRVADDPEAYDTPKAEFTKQLDAIKQSGITVKTFRDALNELTPQL